jgi:hypothetical protein
MVTLVLPLLVLGPLAAYLGGLGLAAEWRPVFPLEYVIAGALHACWVLPVARRHWLLVPLCWPCSVYFCCQGIRRLDAGAPAFGAALLLEGICLLLALSLTTVEPWAERLARWRRARADILTQLRMGAGLLPWARQCARQLLTGAPDTPLGADYQRFAAALADAEHRLRVRLTHIALPEQLRQAILTSASAMMARAEASAAQRAIELEQQALAAAAACREQCERLEHLTPDQRRQLAGQCEALLLELARA